MTKYYVFDKTVNMFCARKIGNELKKGGIVSHEAEPCPICAFSRREYAIQAARTYGLSYEKGEFVVLSEKVED